MLGLKDLYINCNYLTMDKDAEICTILEITDVVNIKIKCGDRVESLTIYDLKGIEPKDRFFNSRCDKNESLGNDRIWKFDNRENPFIIHKINGRFYYSNGIIEKKNESPMPFNYMHELQYGHHSFFNELLVWDY